jgi:hypothetical protein
VFLSLSFLCFALFLSSLLLLVEISLSPLPCAGNEEEDPEREAIGGSRKKGSRSKFSLFILSFS